MNKLIHIPRIGIIDPSRFSTSISYSLDEFFDKRTLSWQFGESLLTRSVGDCHAAELRCAAAIGTE